MAIKEANIALTIHGDSSNLRRDLKKANKALDTLEAKAKRVAANVAKMGAASVLAGAAIATALFNDQRKVIDSLAKTADALQITTENLQALQHLASLAGVESKALNNALQKMQKNLGEAARKGGAAADALADVGLNIKDILKLSPDKQLIELSKAFASVENTTVKASIASDIFGRNGLKMLKVMNQLKDEGLDPTVKALEEMGASLNRVDAAKVEDANDAIEKAKVSAMAMAQVMTVALAPAVQAVADKFTDWVKSTGGLVSKIKELEPVLDGLIKAGKMMAVIFGARLVASFGRYAIAQTIMIRNTIRQITFLKGLDLAAKGLSRGLALLGGPLGIITIAASALLFWGDSAEAAELPTKDLTELVDTLGDSYGDMTKKAKAAAIANLEIGVEGKERELALQRELIAELENEKKALFDKEVELKKILSSGSDSAFLQQAITKNLEMQNKFHETSNQKLIIARGEEEKIVAEIQKAINLKKTLAAGEIVKPKEGGAFTSQKDIDLAAEKIEIQRDYQEDRYLSQLKAGEDLVALTLQQNNAEIAAFHTAQFAKIQALKSSEIEQTGIKAQSAEAQKAIDMQKRRDALTVTSNMFSNLSTLMNTESKSLFEIGKKAAIAGAIVDGGAAAIASYKFGADIGGPIGGALSAGASLAATGTMIANLRSSSFSGGGGSGGAPSGGGGAASQPQQEQQSVNHTFSINLGEGIDPNALFTGEQVTGIVERIQKEFDNGAQFS